MGIIVDLPHDTADEITRQTLLDAFECTQDEVLNKTLYHEDDVKYNKKLLKALNRVIKHFSTPTQIAEFEASIAEAEAEAAFTELAADV